MRQRFFLDQYGCAKNQVDGELLIENLRVSGWEQVDDAEAADLIIINSCGFIEAAKKESLDAVMNARRAYPAAKILLAGCLAERYGADLRENLTEADGFFGNGDLARIAEIAGGVVEGTRPLLVPAQQGVCAGKRSRLLSFAGSAYVKITEGCNNRCSFCAIPLIRGSLRSRPAADIVEEIRALLDQGIFEINLIGQDLAAFGSDTGVRAEKSPLAALLAAVSALPGNFWVRLLYIHPDNFPLDILPVIQADRRILPYFDIPFQSGDDSVLAAMNRHNTAAHYIDLVDRLRAAFADAVLRTTFLTGFPGETDGQFAATKRFLETITPDWSGCFTYSREENTPAASFKNRVPEKLAKKRREELEEAQSRITRGRLLRHVGKTYPVLVEELVSDYAIARAWFQAPEVDGNVVICFESPERPAPGSLCDVRITACTGVDLEAVPVSGQ